MNSDLYVVERVPIGQAWLPNGARYDVIATRHNRVWPGTDSPWTFAVELWTYRYNSWNVHTSWGFFKEQDCYEFLSSFSARLFVVFDRQGYSETVTRKGASIPDAYIRRYN